LWQDSRRNGGTSSSHYSEVEAAAKSPDLSIISNEFLAEVEGMEHQNLAVELLKKLLRDKLLRDEMQNTG
jgi:hypothetical protein